VCPAGTTDCGNGCISVAADPLHCGDCVTVCDAETEVCSSSLCQCKPGLFRCGGVCVNRQTDSTKCGTCELTCTGMKTCQSGICSN
jgi:hypothetical protein